MRRWPVILGLTILVLLLGTSVLSMLDARREAQRSMVVSVPPGTSARLAAGEEVDVFPQQLELRLSQHDTLVIRNDDSEPVTIGPYRVAPGQRFVQRFEGPGTFELICSIHEGERIRIVVSR